MSSYILLFYGDVIAYPYHDITFSVQTLQKKKAPELNFKMEG